MKAIVTKQFGNPPEMTIAERPKPTHRKGFTLIRMHSATINQLSNTIRQGGHPGGDRGIRAGCAAQVFLSSCTAIPVQSTASTAWRRRGYLPLMYLPSVLTGEGKLDQLMNDRYPSIRPTTVREYVAKEGL